MATTPADCMTVPFEMTPVELAVPVDEFMVRCVARDAMPLADGRTIVMDIRFGPAIAGAAARLRLGGPVEFVHMNAADLPVYRLAA